MAVKSDSLSFNGSECQVNGHEAKQTYFKESWTLWWKLMSKWINKQNKEVNFYFFEFEVISVGFVLAANNKRGNNHVISVIGDRTPHALGLIYKFINAYIGPPDKPCLSGLSTPPALFPRAAARTTPLKCQLFTRLWVKTAIFSFCACSEIIPLQQLHWIPSLTKYTQCTDNKIRMIFSRKKKGTSWYLPNSELNPLPFHCVSELLIGVQNRGKNPLVPRTETTFPSLLQVTCSYLYALLGGRAAGEQCVSEEATGWILMRRAHSQAHVTRRAAEETAWHGVSHLFFFFFFPELRWHGLCQTPAVCVVNPATWSHDLDIRN